MAQDEINDLTQLSNDIVEKIEFLSEDVAPLKVNENKKANLSTFTIECKER